MWRACPSTCTLQECFNILEGYATFLKGPVTLPRITGSIMMHAWDSARNCQKTSEGFFSQTACHLGLKSSLCNSPDKALQNSVSSMVIRRPIPNISGGTNTQRHRHTHTQNMRIIIQDGLNGCSNNISLPTNIKKNGPVCLGSTNHITTTVKSM